MVALVVLDGWVGWLVGWEDIKKVYTSNGWFVGWLGWLGSWILHIRIRVSYVQQYLQQYFIVKRCALAQRMVAGAGV